jgi:hypothetical protein
MPDNPNQPTDLDTTPFIVPEGTFGTSQNFPLEFALSGQTKTIDLPDNHSIVVFPGADVTVTNGNDPSHSVTLNITGSDHQTTLENGDVLHELSGRNVVGDFKLDGSEPDLLLIAGNFSYIVDSHNNLVQELEGQGQVVDVIDLLV